MFVNNIKKIIKKNKLIEKINIKFKLAFFIINIRFISFYLSLKMSYN